MQRILSGMRVVEVSAFVAAPLGGMTLAQLGADVIRVDPPRGGLDFHRWPLDANGASLFWLGMNKGKRSVVIDTSLPEGQELVAALAAAEGEDGGIFLSNLPPTGWRAHELLTELRSDLIQLTLQGDREGGSAIDPTVNCATGLPYLNGDVTDGSPVNHVLPAWDLITGQMIATAILAADRHRRRTGEGQHIALALRDVALSTMGHLGFIAEASAGADRKRYGNFIFGTFGRDFLCADGERIMLVAVTGKQWKALCEVMDIRPAMNRIEQIMGVDLSLEGDRFRCREEIARVIDAWVGARRLDDLRLLFDRKGVCWGRYQTVRQLVETDPSCSAANPLFRTIEQPSVGPLLAPGHPLRFSRNGPNDAQAAPVLGEHTEAVLQEVLGLTVAELGQLKKRRVIAMK